VLSDSVSGHRICHLGYTRDGIKELAKQNVRDIVAAIGADAFNLALAQARQGDTILQPADPPSQLPASG
jgi:hypothetical protein